MKAYDDLKALVDGVADDITKADAGNKSAKTRVRKAMMSIKTAAQGVRTGLLAPGEKSDDPAVEKSDGTPATQPDNASVVEQNPDIKKKA
jgi:hypothetical protein